MVVSGISLAATPLRAQFHTVHTVPGRYKIETVRTDSSGAGVPLLGVALVQGAAPTGDTPPAASPDNHKERWIGRYLSVCYPLRDVKITSPYGYRRDPFTGRRKFHNGIDLHARGDEVLAMMEGVVVKVGQDKTSGKYVTLRHGSYTVSYCHLSRILTVKGALIRPRNVVGITGSTGRSTGEHLHITCKLNGKNVDPLQLFEYVRTTQLECVAALVRL